ncbi:hypothetical protein N9V62_00145 [Porticoccaceae bacterium]|nr:hypothetical protein [Porticoccaceae bacterium]
MFRKAGATIFCWGGYRALLSRVTVLGTNPKGYSIMLYGGNILFGAVLCNGSILYAVVSPIIGWWMLCDQTNLFIRSNDIPDDMMTGNMVS